MSNTPSNHLHEKIPHITNAAPYSLHRTDFTDKNIPTLYLHFHPEYELLYLAEGALELIVQNQTYSLTAGEALFIPPGLLHSANALSSTGTFYAVVFSENILSTSQEQIADHLRNTPDRTGHICHLRLQEPWQYETLFYLKRIFFSRSEMQCSDNYIESHILILWEYLCKYHLSTTLENAKSNTPVKIVLDYIHNNYQEDISLEQMNALVHMSKEHLCRIFKKSTGLTPITYLKQYRILKSCHYLKHTDKKISEICFLVGFNNISYFNREFLRVMQTTPSKYRSRE